jgi:hypothetical protein
MQVCDRCAQPLAEPGAVCPTCGPAAPKPTPPAAPASGAHVWAIAVVALVTMISGAVVMLMLGRRSAALEGSAAAAPAATPSPAAQPLAPAPEDDASPSAPKWSAEPGWALDRSRTMTFWLEAEDAVPIWMRRVRPALGVRCGARTIEVFVLTSAASVESSDGQHTVRFRVDEGAELAERWVESDDRQALFAADGAATARRIAEARTLSFGFTPYNASPVVAEFDVRGLSAVMAPVAKTCGLQPSSSAPRGSSRAGRRAGR